MVIIYRVFRMKKSFTLLTLLCSINAFAHEPFIAPLAYITENTQIPVIASYAEDTLIPEYAMKDVKKIQVIDPKQNKHDIETSMIKSATFANIELNEQGTYGISTTASYPLKYVYHQKQWKKFYDMTADKAKPIAERDYLIPSDFKKSPDSVEIKRHWLIQSFITKGKISDIHTIENYPLQVTFQTHPSQLKTTQSLTITAKKDKKPAQVKIEIHAKGTKHENGTEFKTNEAGQTEIKFDKAGEYVITVSEPFDDKQKPTDQYYVITTVNVTE